MFVDFLRWLSLLSLIIKHMVDLAGVEPASKCDTKLNHSYAIDEKWLAGFVTPISCFTSTTADYEGRFSATTTSFACQTMRPNAISILEPQLLTE